MEIIECTPNISEGQNKEIIDILADVVGKVDGVKLLHVDSGKDVNRTVFTFVGVPDAVVDAAFAMYKKALELLTMKQHSGKHPRMGIIDVCPLTPVADISLEQVVEYAESLAKRVGEELLVPVYLYEANARYAYRSKLEQIRRGEYERLYLKMQNVDWIPDYGPKSFNEECGVTAIGARNFLIAYNVNLNTSNLDIAKNIAVQLRESGGTYYDSHGVRTIKKTGLLKGVKAIGWYIEDFNTVQVSVNITDYKMVGLARVFNEVSRLATAYGVEVTGSEIVGLVPYEALEHAGMAFQYNEKLVHTNPIDVAIEKLGLCTVKEFSPQNHILEFVAGIQK
ncbi:MAG: glutamate formimidoyltransferase [Bacteroidales bacterium]